MNAQNNRSRLARQLGITLFLATIAYAWAQAPSKSTPSLAHTPKAWEHLAFEHPGASIQGDPKLAREINRLGKEGWELVDVEMSQQEGTTTGKTFFFKRPKTP